MATTRATENGSQRARAVSSEGYTVSSQASKATRARDAARMRAVCLRVFMLVKTIGNGFDGGLPTSPAVQAFVALRGSRASIASRL